MAPHTVTTERILVTGGQHEAAVLNGVYEQIGVFEDKPHYSKDGMPFDEVRWWRVSGG